MFFPDHFIKKLHEQLITDWTIDKTPNLKLDGVVEQLEKSLGLAYVLKTESNVCFANSPELRNDFKIGFTAMDVLDYVYAVFHSNTYNEQCKESYKIRCPQIPYPMDPDVFWRLVSLGGTIRNLHQYGTLDVGKENARFPKEGSNSITTATDHENWELVDEENRVGRIWINGNQYFDLLPVTVWEYYIGGYRPAQKWLKDRRGSTLDDEGILQYSRLIEVLSETRRFNKEIDAIKTMQ